MRGDLTTLPALRLAELVRRRELSPVELVDAHVARLRQIQPALNPLIEDRFEAARAEAREAEGRARAGGDLPPLLGVPCTIKEFVAVRGMSWTAGLHARRGRRADADATVVERLRRAGAIVLGVTNVPEGGMWMETYNPMFGRTRNPWDPRRTPGGSSGGEAVAVATGGAPFGIGSDIAGSIRIPAGMCGVIGHKPSERLVPNAGHWGSGGEAADRMLCIGPLGRTVDDVEAVLEIIAGSGGTGAAHGALGPRERAAAAGELRGVRVIPVAAAGGVRVARVMREAVDRAAASLAARGAEIVELPAKAWREVFAPGIGVWLRALAEAGAEASFEQLITEGGTLSLSRELIRIALRRPRYSAATLGLAALQRASGPLERLALARAPSSSATQARLEALLGPRTVLLHPPYTRPAPRHRWPLLTPVDAVCTALFSVTGLPGTVVPAGFDPRGLPVAVQVVARRGGDRLTLAVARVLEAALGGWTPAV